MSCSEAMGLSLQKSPRDGRNRPSCRPAVVSLEPRVVLNGSYGTVSNAALAAEIVNGFTAATSRLLDQITVNYNGYLYMRQGLSQRAIGNALRAEYQLRRLEARVAAQVSTADPDY